MPKKEVLDLSALAALSEASDARREARSRLRRTAAAVADAIIDDLRVGDSAGFDVGDEVVRYVVEKVTWRAWRSDAGAAEEDATVTWVSADGVTLTRLSATRDPIAVVDCRYAFVDEEDHAAYQPAAREVYTLGVLAAPADDWDSYRRHLATDEDLVLFTEEAARVADAFARLLADEAAHLNGRVDAMLAARDES